MSDRKLDISELNTKARRYLKRGELEKLYTEIELSGLLGSSYTGAYKDVGYEPLSELIKLTSKSKAKKRHRRWSHIEDKFLLDTYAYVSDVVIALALNIPVSEVTQHRVALKLSKKKKVESFYVVWCNRDNFDEDMSKYNLTKLRGDGVHPLLEDTE